MFEVARQFIVEPRSTGAFAESSEALALEMVKRANISRAQCVVELGPGTGVITEKILDVLSSSSTFFAIELNPSLVKELEERVPDAKVYCDSCVNISKYLEKHNHVQCDAIVSSLPWTWINRKEREFLLTNIVSSLKEGGTFVTFGYVHGAILPAGKSFHMALLNNFSSVKKSSIIWENLPPGFVYYCKK